MPFSCPFRATKPCNAMQTCANQNSGHLIDNNRDSRWKVVVANPCKRAQNRVPQGSGPGGRWFKIHSPRPSFRSAIHLKIRDSSSRLLSSLASASDRSTGSPGLTPRRLLALSPLFSWKLRVVSDFALFWPTACHAGDLTIRFARTASTTVL